MGVRLKRVYFGVSVFYCCLWIIGILSVLLWKFSPLVNNRSVISFVRYYFEISIMGSIFLPIEPVVFLISFITGLLKKIGLKMGIIIGFFLIYLLLWLVYLCLFISLTGF